ncbi:MAG: hypothetical protein HY072_04305 [Deltaproteobacteria bacterium]|nr:hypothetical protein [Deltaproteobacteria bacterium]
MFKKTTISLFYIVLFFTSVGIFNTHATNIGFSQYCEDLLLALDDITAIPPIVVRTIDHLSDGNIQLINGTVFVFTLDGLKADLGQSFRISHRAMGPHEGDILPITRMFERGFFGVSEVKDNLKPDVENPELMTRIETKLGPGAKIPLPQDTLTSIRLVRGQSPSKMNKDGYPTKFTYEKLPWMLETGWKITEAFQWMLKTGGAKLIATGEPQESAKRPTKKLKNEIVLNRKMEAMIYDVGHATFSRTDTTIRTPSTLSSKITMLNLRYITFLVAVDAIILNKQDPKKCFIYLRALDEAHENLYSAHHYGFKVFARSRKHAIFRIPLEDAIDKFDPFGLFPEIEQTRKKEGFTNSINALFFLYDTPATALFINHSSEIIRITDTALTFEYPSGGPFSPLDISSALPHVLWLLTHNSSGEIENKAFTIRIRRRQISDYIKAGFKLKKEYAGKASENLVMSATITEIMDIPDKLWELLEHTTFYTRIDLSSYNEYTRLGFKPIKIFDSLSPARMLIAINGKELMKVKKQLIALNPTFFAEIEVQ